MGKGEWLASRKRGGKTASTLKGHRSTTEWANCDEVAEKDPSPWSLGAVAPEHRVKLITSWMAGWPTNGMETQMDAHALYQYVSTKV